MAGVLAKPIELAAAVPKAFDYARTKFRRRAAFWSKVKVTEQPALSPSSPIRASAKEPLPS